MRKEKCEVCGKWFDEDEMVETLCEECYYSNIDDEDNDEDVYEDDDVDEYEDDDEGYYDSCFINPC